MTKSTATLIAAAMIGTSILDASGKIEPAWFGVTLILAAIVWMIS